MSSHLLQPARPPDGYALAPDRHPVHDLIFGQRLALIVCRRAHPRRLAPPYLHLHVLELDAHQQEVDLADHHIPQVVPRAIILKLYVQAVLDANLHLAAAGRQGRASRVSAGQGCVRYKNTPNPIPLGIPRSFQERRYDNDYEGTP